MTAVGLSSDSGAFKNAPFTIDLTQAELEAMFSWVIFEVQRWGYGYGWSHDKTIKFGIVVLLVHAVFTVVYTIYRLWFFAWPVRKRSDKVWASSAWKEPGELIALALTSSDERARQVHKGVAGGVENAETWRLKVRLRERGPRGLQLVLGNELPSSNEDEDWIDRKVEVGKKYI